MICLQVILITSLWAAFMAAELPDSVDAEVDATMREQAGHSDTAVAETAVDRAVRRVLNRFDVNKKGLREALGQIESQLVGEVDLNEPAANLEFITKLLEGTEETSGIPAIRLDALQLLASLNNVWKGNSKCNQESHIILFKNNEALLKAVQVPRSKFPAHPNRMQAVLRKIALKHAEDCKLLYAKTYNRLAQEFPADLHKIVKTFFDIIVELHIKNSKPSWSLFGGSKPKLEPSDALNVQKIIKSFSSLDGPEEAEIAYDFLKNYVHDDPDQWFLTRVPRSETDNRLVLNQTKIGHLMSRHLIEPCTRYVDFMGPGLFEPVEFDALIMDNDDRHLNSDLAEFQRARIRYQLCKRLVREDAKGLFKGIVDVARKAPVHQFN